MAWLRVTLLKNGMLNGLVLALMIAYVTAWDCQRLQPYAEFGSARRKPNGLCAPDLPEILYRPHNLYRAHKEIFEKNS